MACLSHCCNTPNRTCKHVARHAMSRRAMQEGAHSPKPRTQQPSQGTANREGGRKRGSVQVAKTQQLQPSGEPGQGHPGDAAHDACSASHGIPVSCAMIAPSSCTRPWSNRKWQLPGQKCHLTCMARSTLPTLQHDDLEGADAQHAADVTRDLRSGGQATGSSMKRWAGMAIGRSDQHAAAGSCHCCRWQQALCCTPGAT